MTNWEAETNRLKSQQQFEANQKNETAKQEIENCLQEEIKNVYEKNILAGFEILDSYHIMETLTEIRDQVWKCGEVFKKLDSFDEFKIFCTNKYTEWHNKQSLPINHEREKSEIKNLLEHDNRAQYTLINPKFLKYSKGGMVADNSGPGDGGGYSYSPPCIYETNTSLTIASDGNNIIVISDQFCDWPNELINIKENNQEKIQTRIKNLLLKDCFYRRDYTKIGEDVLAHPDLYKKYLKENSSQQDHSPQPQKRSFLDKLFR